MTEKHSDFGRLMHLRKDWLMRTLMRLDSDLPMEIEMLKQTRLDFVMHSQTH